MTGSTTFDSSTPFQNETARQYFDHSSAQRVNTDAVVVEALRREYPRLHLTVVPQQSSNLLAYAAAGHAAVAPLGSAKDTLQSKLYVPAARRLNGINDGLADIIHFGKFLFEWKAKEFVLYIANGRDGASAYPQIQNQYILSAGVETTNQLLIDAGRWANELHDQIWVFDGGFWQKSTELWESVQKSEWEDVILEQSMKDAIIKDVDNFFNGRDTYTKLKVPWKRGVIYYGPPGNGKTISIKATMHALLKRKDPVPTLYVRTLAGFGGPEYSLRQIFNQARRYAPCYLIFEDLDTVITPNVRSYFFNEVDGLKSNDGIFMVGSTNHLDQLDPGIAKRPSRFDRKYLFPDPNEAQRTQYAQYWQGKLKDNNDVVFPDRLCAAVARITKGFSFAYMQEAFVATLLAIAVRDKDGREDALNGSLGQSSEHRNLAQAIEQLNNHKQEGIYNCSIHGVPPTALSSRCEGTDMLFNSTERETGYRRPNDKDWSDLANRLSKLSFVSQGWDHKTGERVLSASLDLIQARSIRALGAVSTVTFPIDMDRDVDVLELVEYQEAGNRDSGDGDDKDLDDLVLWREFKKQVKILREEAEDEA